MENTENVIYSEVYSLIKLLGYDYESLLPDKVKETIEIKRDKNYNPQYSMDIPLEKQNIHSDSMAILANIQYNYWCRTPEEKQEFLKELKQNDIDRENKIREMYNPDNIFKKKNENKIESNQEEVALVEVKEKTFINKIIEFFNKLFGKIKKK